MDLPLRVYKPIYSEFWLIDKIVRRFPSKRKPIKFVAVSLEGENIQSKITKYSVVEKPQGIVGQCYLKGEILIDDNLRKNSKMYNLTDNQIDRVWDLCFAIAVPIKNANGDILNIVTFDSKTRLKIPCQNIDDIKGIVRVYIRDLHDNFPQLFK